MSAAKHTPGPWGVNGDDNNNIGNLLGVWVAKVDRAQPDGFNGRVAQAFVNCLVNTDEACRANANLIAAAPELLEALEGLCELAELRPGHLHEYKAAVYGARTAIAKARGEV